MPGKVAVLKGARVMGTCFVMQPFDGGVFDKRYEEVFAPAIRDTGLDPYRVDQDPKVSIPIQEIEAGIRESQMCLAEITLDNPNVWFELGYAIAYRKEVILICSEQRTAKFPFDIQHRTIIRYTTTSPSDFQKLRGQITSRLKACLQKAETLTNASEISKLTKFEGLEQHEVVALAALAENLDHPDDHASTYQIKRDMEASGFTKVATVLALGSLAQKKLITLDWYEEFNEHYAGYQMTGEGWAWMSANKDNFVLRRPPKTAPDDIPF
jgi:hypothetical protein